MSKEIRYGWWSYDSFCHQNSTFPDDLCENELKLPCHVYTKPDGHYTQPDGSYTLIWQVTTKKELSGAWKDQVYVGPVVDWVAPQEVDLKKLVVAIHEVEALYLLKYGKRINLLAMGCWPAEYNFETLVNSYSQPKSKGAPRFVASHSVCAFNVAAWRRNRLQEFSSFAEKIEYVGQREVGETASGDWYYIGEIPREDGSKVIYHGSYSDSCVAGAMTDTYANIYVASQEDGEDEYERDKMHWENRPEWAEDEENDEDWDKNDEDLGSFGHEEY
jgi:hypothetical protein